MNFKRILIAIVACLSLFSIVGISSAAITEDINLYGASAQFNLWKTYAVAYMKSQGCVEPCTSTLVDSKNYIASCQCGGVTRYFRSSSKASYDGVCALMGNFINVPPYGPGGNPNCSAGCGTPVDAHKRVMANTAGTAVDQCVTVTVAGSDVPVECFAQESHGALLGPCGGAGTNRNFKTSPEFWTGDEPCAPLAVPFSFFANITVTKGGVPITNIVRDNAELIFSGAVGNWDDMVDSDGVAYDSQDTIACLRHAGSGTHASLDAYLTSPLLITQKTTPAKRYFNDGSADMMKCVNGGLCGTWTGAGAIGYADSDQSLTSYTNTNRLSLNGVPVSRANIIGGNYNFYGLQQVYGTTARTAPLCQFLQCDPNVTLIEPWTRQCEMWYSRDNGCSAFPLSFKGDTCADLCQ
jgi:ABC-type phosphate transport system substrate-binding protein